MGKAKTGKVTRKVGNFTLTQASPNDPIYTRGWVIGGMHQVAHQRGAGKSPNGFDL